MKVTCTYGGDRIHAIILSTLRYEATNDSREILSISIIILHVHVLQFESRPRREDMTE